MSIVDGRPHSFQWNRAHLEDALDSESIAVWCPTPRAGARGYKSAAPTGLKRHALSAYGGRRPKTEDAPWQMRRGVRGSQLNRGAGAKRPAFISPAPLLLFLAAFTCQQCGHQPYDRGNLELRQYHYNANNSLIPELFLAYQRKSW